VRANSSTIINNIPKLGILVKNTVQDRGTVMFYSSQDEGLRLEGEFS
jgi:hypothetical protein